MKREEKEKEENSEKGLIEKRKKRWKRTKV
jgi:hypothetical protein